MLRKQKTAALLSLLLMLGVPLALASAQNPQICVDTHANDLPAVNASEHPLAVTATIDPKLILPQHCPKPFRVANVTLWLILSLLITQLIIFGIKKLKKLEVMRKSGTVVVLSMASVFCVASLVGGLSIQEAMFVFFGTLVPKLINDIAAEREYTTE